MRRSHTVAGILAAGFTALAIAATPALAAGAGPVANPNGPNSSGTCTATGTAPSGTGTMGRGQGRGMGQGQGMGQGTQGRGMGQGTVTAPMGTLTAAQQTALAAMAEEEKLAHDLYVALGTRYPSVAQFSRIAASESRHLAAVRTLLTRYGITDPTAGQPAGKFASSDFQTLYDSLLAGATSSTLALAAGVTVENADIADLKSAMATVTAPDVLQVYTNLLRGSGMHLAAFSR